MVDRHMTTGWTYLYPWVTMELTRRQMTNSGVGRQPGRGLMNQFVHIRSFRPGTFRVVVRPNCRQLTSIPVGSPQALTADRCCQKRLKQ